MDTVPIYQFYQVRCRLDMEVKLCLIISVPIGEFTVKRTSYIFQNDLRTKRMNTSFYGVPSNRETQNVSFTMREPKVNHKLTKSGSRKVKLHVPNTK